ncbi:30 kDa heat shock protein [Pyrenochaeta sp. MPI-SDFR-AT-0127]|nr:30 kDa heat shock protein [Pyrenochaeta sp. MPI-SDFR-AT-0127]
MSLFPRFTQECAPIFRLFDEYDRQAFRDLDGQFKSIRSFTPKFDVKETKTHYELHGELAGVEQKNINIEWTDNNTLTISGRHEYQKKLDHQPTVEDETSANTSKDTSVAKQSEKKDVAKQTESSNAKYWVSERSVGEFHRSFAFPARIDQDAIKASLKNGILSIVIPKATAPQARKIYIE